jgi:hypothetical protein
MKIRLLFPVAALALLGFLAPAQAQNSKAVEAFKAEMAAVAKLSEKVERETSVEDPASGVRGLRTLLARLRKVRTDALPEDLKGAYIDFVAEMGKMERVFAGWPETAAEFTKFVRENVARDAKFVEKLTPRLAAIEKELAPVSERLDELGKKYGIDDLGSLKGRK